MIDQLGKLQCRVDYVLDAVRRHNKYHHSVNNAYITRIMDVSLGRPSALTFPQFNTSQDGKS